MIENAMLITPAYKSTVVRIFVNALPIILKTSSTIMQSKREYKNVIYSICIFNIMSNLFYFIILHVLAPLS